jgi:hypothetical protein
MYRVQLHQYNPVYAKAVFFVNSIAIQPYSGLTAMTGGGALHSHCGLKLTIVLNRNGLM